MTGSPTPMQILFDAYFDSQAALAEAFRFVGEQPRVASCSLESEQLRLRYVLPEEDAPELAERIYQTGGLRWCTRHVLSDTRAPERPAGGRTEGV